MKLEELIYERFVSNGKLTERLAVYSDKPAVFSMKPPDDSHEGWGGKVQYPKVVYNFDLQANEERKSMGTLNVSLLCQNTSEVFPEYIEVLVKECLRDVLLKPDDDHVYAFSWARTEGFAMEKSTMDLVLGSDIRFDIYEYTSQQTSDPDPIMASNAFVKKIFPEAVVIGHDRLGQITIATPETPVIFCELTNVEKSEETNNVAWMDGRIAIHILCPDSSIRKKMAAAIVNTISLDGEIIMLDHSPMYCKELKANYKSDYLKDGLIFFVAHFGLLRYKKKPHRITGGLSQSKYAENGGLNNGSAELRDFY